MAARPSESAGKAQHRCTACREAHTACDREQPCARCVRIGKADACRQPAVLRKRGRPRNVPTRSASPLQPAAPAPRITQPPPVSMPPDTTPVWADDDDDDGDDGDEADADPEVRSDEDLCTQIERSLEDSLAESQGMGQLLVLLLAELNEVKRSSREIGNTVESLKRKRDQLDHKLEVMQRTQASQLRHLALAQQRSMHQLESMLAQLAPSQLTLLQDGPMPHAPLPMPQPMPLPMPPPMLTFPPPPLPYSQGMGSVVRRNNSFPASVLQVLPFLPSYDFSKEPCVIEDLGQMLVVASLNEPECFDDIEPSMVFYASPSLCSLLGYQQGELIGRSTADICEGTFDVMVSILAHLLCGSPTPVGSRYTIEGRYLSKAPGQPFNVRSRHQTLYGPSGTAQWMLSVIDEVLPPDPTLPPAVPYSHLLSDPYTRRSLCSAVEARLGRSFSPS